MSTLTPTQPLEAEVNDFLTTWTNAFLAKDIDALMACYAPDVRVFDAIPPHECVSAAEFRETWLNCFPYFPDKFELEIHDQQVTADGNLAFSTCLYRINGLGDEPSMKSFLRSTHCLRKIGGEWKILHEHTSVPFNPFNSEAAFIPDPNVRQTLEDICEGHDKA